MSVIKYISDVRRATQELNSKLVSDEDIVAGLNEGLKDVLEIIGRRAEGVSNSVLGKYTTLPLVSRQSEYSIPKDCLGRRVQLIKYKDGPDWCKLDPIMLSDEDYYSNLFPSTYLEGYMIMGDKIKVFPQPSSNITEGLQLVYSENLPKLVKPVGIVSSVIQGNKIYLSSFELYDSDGYAVVEVNDYISVTNPYDSTVVSNFRIASIDETDEFITVYTGVSSSALTIASVDTTNMSFTFGVTDLSTVISGDSLTVTGSTGNDGTYTIIGIDTDNYTVYTREDIVDGTVDGSFSINIGVNSSSDYEFENATILETARSLDRKDEVAKFGFSTYIKLPDIFKDYVVQYAVIEAIKIAKEPTDEAMIKLQRLSKGVEGYQEDRVATNRFRIR
jgi:hypothetical protein